MKSELSENDTSSILPKHGRGRLSAADQERYDAEVERFVGLIVEIQYGFIKSKQGELRDEIKRLVGEGYLDNLFQA